MCRCPNSKLAELSSLPWATVVLILKRLITHATEENQIKHLKKKAETGLA